jgi:hypothetical protein
MDPKELADRYVAVWIEPDTEQRRKRIAQLWAEDGVHILEPPLEVREAARARMTVHPLWRRHCGGSGAGGQWSTR